LVLAAAAAAAEYLGRGLVGEQAQGGEQCGAMHAALAVGLTDLHVTGYAVCAASYKQLVKKQHSAHAGILKFTGILLGRSRPSRQRVIRSRDLESGIQSRYPRDHGICRTPGAHLNFRNFQNFPSESSDVIGDDPSGSIQIQIIPDSKSKNSTSSPTDWWTLLNCETIPIVKKVDIFALLVKYGELSHISQEKF
jgi:hypothetical protein